MASKPSFVLKVDRAEKHLGDLEAAIRTYASGHPYEVREGRKSKNNPGGHRFFFTKHPGDDVAILAGDFMYDIHSGLNHLACALVPSSVRRSVDFPIFWQGVWEPFVKGENNQRYKDRQRWLTCTRSMPDEAVAIFKMCQPPDTRPNEPNTHWLAVLNRLRNADAHGKLPVVASMLTEPTIALTTAEGVVEGFRPAVEPGPIGGYEDGAPILGLPIGAMNVQVRGTPHVVIRLGGGPKTGGYPINPTFRELMLETAREMIGLIQPFALAT